METQSSRRRLMRFSLRSLMIAVLVVCAFLAGRMPVLRRAEKAEERARALVAQELADFADRTRVDLVLQTSQGDRVVLIRDRDTGATQTVKVGESFTAGNLIVTITEFRNFQATFEAGGSAVRLALGD
jgi:hypothetical protein